MRLAATGVRVAASEVRLAPRGCDSPSASRTLEVRLALGELHPGGATRTVRLAPPASSACAATTCGGPSYCCTSALPMIPTVPPAPSRTLLAHSWAAVCPHCPNHAPALPRQPTKCAGKCAGWVLRLRLRSPSAWPILSPAGVCWTNGGAGSPQPAKKQGLSRPPSPKNYYVGGFAPGGFPQCESGGT